MVPRPVSPRRAATPSQTAPPNGRGRRAAPPRRSSPTTTGTAGCASLDATAKQVRSAARELGLSEGDQYQLTEVRDDSARCITITEDVGGTIFVILRGPSN